MSCHFNHASPNYDRQNMSKYTIKDIKKVNRLYDHMSQREIAEKTGIPRGTLASWSRKGWINTDTNHQKGPRKYDEETVERADRLWDVMPLPAVSEVLDIPIPTLFCVGLERLDQHGRQVEGKGKRRQAQVKSIPRRSACESQGIYEAGGGKSNGRAPLDDPAVPQGLQEGCARCLSPGRPSTAARTVTGCSGRTRPPTARGAGTATTLSHRPA